MTTALRDHGAERAARLSAAEARARVEAPVTSWDRGEIVRMADEVARRDEQTSGLLARLAAYEGAAAREAGIGGLLLLGQEVARICGIAGPINAGEAGPWLHGLPEPHALRAIAALKERRRSSCCGAAMRIVHAEPGVLA